MSELLKYKGFSARVEFSGDDETFRGKVIGIEDDVAFTGSSVRELKKGIKDAVDAYIERRRRKGLDARKTYSGKLLFRLSPELHAGIAEAAADSGQSINEWGREALTAGLEAASKRAERRRAARTRRK